MESDCTDVKMLFIVFYFLNIGEEKECVSQAEGDKSMGRSQMTNDNIMLDKVDTVNSPSLRLLPSDLSIKTKVSAVNSLEKCINYSSGVDVETTVKIKNETPDILDELDFVVLKERKRMLLSRCYFPQGILAFLLAFLLKF